MEQKYVAFFDSGVGGLTLLTAFCRAYPRSPVLYFGDNANAPYGDRDLAEIRRLALAAFEEIARFPVRAAVVACNTVTAVCIDELRRRFSFPVVGVEPAVRPAVSAARGGRVLLLCTRATLAAERVRRLLAASADTAVVAHCPRGLAAAVEKNIFDLSALSVRPFIPPGKFDAAVLGCTHYVWLRRAFEAELGCPVFDGTEGTIRRLAAVAGLPAPEFAPSARLPSAAQEMGEGAGEEGTDSADANGVRHRRKTTEKRGIGKSGAHGESRQAGVPANAADRVGEEVGGNVEEEGGGTKKSGEKPGRADHRIGTADHREGGSGVSEQNKNVCSYLEPKKGQFFPIFLGSGANFDARAYNKLQI